MANTKSKTFNFDFYYLKIPNSNKRFEDLLQHVSNSANDQSRNLKRSDGDLIRLKHATINSWNDCCEGSLVKNRISNTPPGKMDLQGKDSPLDLKEDEGIYEETAFLYNPRLSVLLLQRNKTAVLDGDFVRYFKAKGGTNCEIELSPILKKDVLDRLDKLTEVKKLVIKLKGPENLTPLKGQEGLLDLQMLELAKELRAVEYTISVSSGRKKENFLSSKAKDIAKKIFRHSSEQSLEVKKIEIGGINQDDERDYLDLISDRMTEKHSIKYTGKHILYTDKQDALRKIWEKYSLDLESMCLKKE